MNRLTQHHLLAGLLLLACTFSLTACDSATDEGAFDSEEVAFLYNSLSQELSLTASQQAAFSKTLARHDHRDRSPGFLWIVADSLQKTLTPEQLERLLSRTRSMEDDDDFRGLHGFPGSGGFYGVGGVRGGSGQHGISPLDEVLNLTDDQQAEIQAIHQDFRDQVRALLQTKRDGTISNEDFLAQLQALQEAKQTALGAVLTDEQKAALEAFRADRAASFEAYRAEVIAVRNTVLGLSTDEADALGALFSDQLDAREVLVEQARAATLSREAFRSEIEALLAATDKALQALLTDDQYEVVLIHNALSVRIGRQGHRGQRGERGRPDGDTGRR